jgi:antitoxin MazE
MKTRIQKWGNSLAVRIPKSFADGLRFADNSPAEMGLEDGAIVIRPDPDRAWDLDGLLAGVTDDNLHAAAWETEADAASGWTKAQTGEDPEGAGEDGDRDETGS